MVSPVRSSSDSSSRTWISSSRPPRTWTAATPGIGSSARLTCSSAMRRSRRSPSSPRNSAPSPASESSITGSSEGSKRSTSGRSASSGRNTVSSFSRVSWTASDISVSHENSRTTSETPARETLETRRRPATTPSASSIGPRDLVLHLLRRGARVLGAHREGGVRELRHQRQRQPEVGEDAEDDRARKTTATATGRWVAKERTARAPRPSPRRRWRGARPRRARRAGQRAGALSPAPRSLALAPVRRQPRPRPLHHPHLGAGLEAGLPGDDHAVAGREGDALARGGAHLDVGGVLEHRLDQQPLDGVVGLEPVDPGLVVVDQERALGQQQRVLAHVGDQLHVEEHARAAARPGAARAPSP